MIDMNYVKDRLAIQIIKMILIPILIYLFVLLISMNIVLFAIVFILLFNTHSLTSLSEETYNILLEIKKNREKSRR